jgi:hypothetical protein
MPDDETPPPMIAPLFSIIIPLEFHRGQWDRAWQGWQSQTLDRASFETILVVPPDFPDRDKLAELGDLARLEYSHHSHDIGLCAAGAAKARGKFLFFTESHCWPEPDVLELCLQAFHAHPDWTGFSCKSVRVSHNRLSEAEADMYEADTEYGMTVHPWRKILDVCFATRREAYEACGGLRPELGHFAEWALAASYFEMGYTIGYLPEARVHHYYIGSLADLKAFTLDFVQGEIRYLSENRRERDSSLLEIPPELICQDNFNRDMARAILRMVGRDMLTSPAVNGRSNQAMWALGRWTSPAICGDGLIRAEAAAVAVYAHLDATLAAAISSHQRLGVVFKRFIAALIRYQRLRCIRAERLSRRGGTRDGMAGSGEDAAILDQTGFYPLEKFDGRSFRWSETAAAVRLRVNDGDTSIRIKCAPVRDLAHGIDLRFYLDGRRIPDGAIAVDLDGCEIRIDLPQSGTYILGWICRRFEAKADPRHLGLPVVGIELVARSSKGTARDNNAAVEDIRNHESGPIMVA